MAFSDYFYTSGTCSITTGSKNLVGVGTSWQLNNVVGAILFIGQDFGFIASVEDETHATMLDNWGGSTKTNQPYRMWLVPAAAATALMNNTRLAQIIASIESAQTSSEILTALADLSPTGDQLAFFTDADTMDLVTFKAWARAFLGLADVAAARDYLGAASAGSPLVVLVEGQSNATREPAYVWTPPKNLKIWNYTKVAGNVGTAFVSPTGTVMGLAHSIGKRLAEKHPDRMIYIINIALGGLPITSWLPGAPAGSDVWQETINNVAPALATIGATKINKFRWWQGEADSSLANRALYLGRFETLMARFRSQSWFTEDTETMIFGTVSTAISGYADYGAMSQTLQQCVKVDPQRRKFFYTACVPVGYWMDTMNVHMTGAGYELAGALAESHAEGAFNGIQQPLIVDAETGNTTLKNDRAGMLISTIENLSTDGTARASFQINGAGGVFNMTAGSGTAATWGYSGVGGLFYDTPTLHGFRINVVQKVQIDDDGFKVGTTVADPVASNAAGTSIRASVGIASSASGAAPLSLNRMTSDGAIAGFRRQNVIVGSITVTGSATTYNVSSDFLRCAARQRARSSHGIQPEPSTPD